MKVTVRPATIADAPVLSSLNGEVQAVHAAALPDWFKPPSPSQFSPDTIATLVARPDRFLFVAEVDTELVGYAFARVASQPETPWRYAFSMIFVDQIGVRAAWRRKGVGRALVAAVRDTAADMDVSLVALDVWAFNAEALAFFGRCGFEPFRHHLWIR
jgi:GNAT superfamily N-acetyltransferase